MSQTVKTNNPDMNPDPITHAPGAHIVGTGVGAAVGGAAGVAGAIATGAVIGTVAGPVGTAVGAAVGAVVGGLAGKAVAEDVNPSVEDKYWRENFATHPYAFNKSYDQFGPAYRYGWESYTLHNGSKFEDVEIDLERGWDGAKGESRLIWLHAKPAARDAWDRVAGKHQQKA
jgi:hypothetical protein